MAYTTIDDPSAHFQTLLWTGDDNNDRALTNTGNSDLQPDWVWIKNRSGGTKSHQLVDSSRGVTKYLFSEATTVESTLTNRLDSFDSDGFTTDNHSSVNESSRTYVAWQWKANGGTTSSNSDGDITSTVQANTTAGFSIVTYTGNGTDGHTVGTGLTGLWDVAILKNRGQTDYWTVSQTGTNQVMLLHDTVAQANHSTAYMTRSSGVMGLVGAGDLGMVNGSSETYVAYVFKEVKGYSKFGSYTGNGAEPGGPFVYTGFKPAWFIIHASSENGQAWVIGDSARDSSNLAIRKLFANNNAIESAAVGDNNWDFLSNGFKIRTQDDAMNKNDVTYFFMAFAESPFVSSEGVPTTAR
tara:strand:+ start:1373 stop:2434 length:1062 start_codon:yes stop_codon:yes gene_type:complete